MNPRVIWYLVRTDLRRLWPLVVFLWLVIASAASAYWFVDFERLSKLSGDSRSFPDLVWAMAWRNEFIEILTRFLSQFLVPGVVLVCGSIGICGSSWTGVRPVRKCEWIGAKVVETLLFVMLPLVVAVGVNLGLHGFSPWKTISASAMNIAPLLGSLVLIGVLCGTFRSWAMWLAGFVGFFVLCALLIKGSWFSLNQIDVWGTKEILAFRDLLIVAGLVVLALLRNRFRGGFAVAAMAWPVIAVSMVAALFLYLPRSPHALVESNKELDEVAIPQEFKSISGNWNEAGDRSNPPMIQWLAPMVEPQQTASGVVQWAPTNEIRLKKDGADLPTKVKRIGRDDWKNASRWLDWDVFVTPDHDEAALRAALPPEAGNLVVRMNQGNVPVFFAGMTLPKFPKKSVLEGKIDFTTDLDGFLFRYEKVAELKLGESIQGADADGRFRMAASHMGGARVDIARMRAGDDANTAKLAVVLMIPEKGITFRLQSENEGAVMNGAGTEMMAGLHFFTERFQMRKVERERIERLFGYNAFSKAKVGVFERRLVAKTSRTLHAPQLSVVDSNRRQEVLNWPEPVDGDLAGFFRTYLHERPDPETCTEEEAGRWIYRLLSLSNSESSWRGREMVPFARSHPNLMLKMPASVWARESIEDAIAGGFPAERKDDYLRVMKVQRDDGAFASMFRSAVRRGWDDQAKAIAVERILSSAELSEPLVTVAVSCGDASLYPKILEKVRSGISWEIFCRIRELPGIDPGLDGAVADYQKVMNSYQKETIRPLMIPASRGSKRALRNILEIVSYKARTGEGFNGWRDVLEVVRLPISPRERNAGSVDFKFGNLSAEDFEWSSYLQQWLPKESFRLPEP